MSDKIGTITLRYNCDSLQGEDREQHIQSAEQLQITRMSTGIAQDNRITCVIMAVSDNVVEAPTASDVVVQLQILEELSQQITKEVAKGVTDFMIKALIKKMRKDN
jgi:hypothetical protein